MYNQIEVGRPFRFYSENAYFDGLEVIYLAEIVVHNPDRQNKLFGQRYIIYNMINLLIKIGMVDQFLTWLYTTKHLPASFS